MRSDCWNGGILGDAFFFEIVFYLGGQLVKVVNDCGWDIS